MEGNRRIAALKHLQLAFAGSYSSRTWRSLVQGVEPHSELFTQIPYILAGSRADVTAYLGFRHVTGIKQWDPTQKAEFIASMVEDMGMSYDTVRKQIGMQTDTVPKKLRRLSPCKQIESLDIGGV